MKKLPIGIQTFSEIILSDYYYIDKTQILYNLADSGKYYFLSRPRRFGKSLFLDTLKEAFSANQELFKGLYLEQNWDWTKKHPVIKIDLGTAVMKNPEDLKEILNDKLHVIAESETILFQTHSIGEKFRELIRILEKKYSSKVVILIDEYDKPILDNITETEVARSMRDGLRNFYSVIKGSDAHIKFVFITGVSKFSKVNLFSGLNNIQDISLDERYSSICGYTESDLSVFEDRMEGVNREEIKKWYNGYNFLGEKVYNPFDILLFLDQKKFKNYWFETGTPTFLIDLIEKNKYPTHKIEKSKLTESALSIFDVDSISLENLLFQTGYLTIDYTKSIGPSTLYYFKYPNLEVKHSFNDSILQYITNNSTDKEDNKILLYEILNTVNLPLLKNVFHSFFASIPHDWYRKNQLANYEAYYASIFYCYFASLGLDVKPEDVTNHGQVDMTVFLDNKVFVFEFKVIEIAGAGSALQKIKEKRYYEKYLDDFVVGDRHAYPLQRVNDKSEIYLIGVEFSRDRKNIENLEWEKL
jgi:hypothetical protein